MSTIELLESLEYESDSEHSRWDEDHRQVCEDCYAHWYDEQIDAAADARLDAMIEAQEDE